MESSVSELAWPPQPGQYDARGMVKVPGELTAMFLAQTFEEVRAFVQGLAQSKSPGRDGKVQVLCSEQLGCHSRCAGSEVSGLQGCVGARLWRQQRSRRWQQHDAHKYRVTSQRVGS